MRKLLALVLVASFGFAANVQAQISISNLTITPGGNQCTASSHQVTADVVPSSGNLTAVTLSYAFNGGSTTTVNMTPNGGNNFKGTISAATPANATVTWTVSATSDQPSSNSVNGTAYNDAPTLGMTAATSATPPTICSGSNTSLSATISTGSLPTAPAASAYCVSTHTSGCSGDAITQVTLGNISNATGTACGSTSHYTDFTGQGGAMTTTLAAGATNTLTLSVGTDPNQYFGAWIDYNHNGIYEASEFLGASTNLGSSGTGSVSFVVPTSAYNGLTHIRIVGGNDNPVTASQACGASSSPWGETQDYDVTITGALALAPYTGAYTISWSDGTNVVGATNPLTVSATGNTTYTATITVNGCSFTSTPVTVTVNPLPTAPNGTNSSQCGLAVPTASVSDPNGYTTPTFNWYAASSGGSALQSSTSTTYNTAISSTTIFYVSVINPSTGCESPRTAVTVTVAPPTGISVSPGVTTSLCANTVLNLNASSVAAPAYTYSWTVSPEPGSGMSGTLNGAAQNVTPTIGGSYVYTVTGTNGSCTATATVTGTVGAAPVISSTSATPSTICEGGSSTLAVTSIGIGSGTATLGTGSTQTGATSQPTSFNNRWPSYRMQTVYTAAELQAIGLSAGNLTSMAWTITTLGDAAFNNNFRVKISNTALSVLTDFVDTTTGFQDVRFNNTYTHAVGVNTIAFDVPFNWDGTSNIIIQVMMDGADAINNAITNYTATAGNMVAFTATNASNTASLSNQRLDVIFGGQVATNVAGNYTWTWNPGALNGVSVTVSPTTTTNYTVTGTDGGTGCSNTSAPLTLTVNPKPTAPAGSNSTQCGLATPTASVSDPNGFTTPTFNWYSAATAGSLLQSNTSTTYTTPINSTTAFYVSVVNPTTGCESGRTPVTVTVNAPDPITVFPSANPSAICLGANIALNATSVANPAYTYSWTATPATGSGMSGTVSGAAQTVTPTATGTYVYTVTGTNGSCTTTATVTQTVGAVPVVTGATATPGTVCSGASVVLAAQSIPALPGTATVGTQTLTDITGGPYRSGLCADYQVQYLFTAAELNAAGIQAGNITALSFNVTSVGSGTMPNYKITISPTSSTTLTGFEALTAPVLVYNNAAGYTAVSGVNTHAFDVPFNWDGTSNIIVQICNDNTCSGSSTVSLDGNQAGKTVHATAATACGTAGGGTVSPNRPLITFSAQVGTNVTSSYTWTWNPGNLSGSTVTVNPTATTTYTATATNAATGCNGSSAPVTVTVNPLPTAPTASNSTQCGLAVPTASVSDPNGFTTPTFKWYAAPSGGTALQSSTSTTYTTAINANTTFYVSVVNPTTGCESGRTAVTVTVNQATAISVSPSPTLTICLGANISLNGTSTATPAYTYSWAANPAAGSGMTVGVSGAVQTVTPTAAGTYVYTITGTNGSCTTTATVTATVGAVPVITTATATPATMCGSQPVQLTATSVGVAPGTAAVGTSTANLTGTTSQPTSFNNRWPSYRMQTVFTAAELQAAGLSAGNITSMAWTTTTQGDAAFNNNFRVKIANTALSVLTDFVDSTVGFQDVRFNRTYTHAIGVNTITFDVPYNWNGTSNIVIQVMMDGADNINNAQTYYTATAGNTVAYTATAATNSASLSTQRLNTIFGGPVATNITSSYTWTWNPGALNGATVTVTPSVGVTNYTVTATDAATGCNSTSGNVTVTVNPIPVAPTGNGSTQCGTQVPTASVTNNAANTFANPTFNWYLAATGGTATQSSTSTTYTSPVATTTTYYVSVKDPLTGCESSRTPVVVTVNTASPITPTPGTTATVCQNGTLNLGATSPASPAYSYTWTASPVSGSGIPTSLSGSNVSVTPTGTGPYTYTVTGTNGSCSNTATVTVTITAAPVVSTATATPSTVCAGGNVTLAATSIGIGAGTVTLGTNSTLTGATTQPTSFNNRWPSYRMQTVYTAAELQALGLSAGNITSMAWTITTQGDAAFNNNFRVKVGNTALSTLTTFVDSTVGFQDVRFNRTYTHAIGVNTIGFDVPFNWNGTSNIIIQVMMDGADLTNNAITYYTATAGNTVAFTATAATNTASLSNQRLTVTFGGQTAADVTASQTWVWNPGAVSGSTVTVNPLTTTSYTATVTNPGTGCSSTSSPVTVTVNPLPTSLVANNSTQCGAQVPTASVTDPNGFTTPTIKWYNAPTAGTVLQTGTSTTYTTIVSTTTTFYVTVTNPTTGCESARTPVTVTVSAPPAINVSGTPLVGGVVTVCVGQTATLNVSSPNDPNYTYSWTGAGLNTNSGPSVTATPTNNTTYTVTAFDNSGGATQGCAAVSTINVVISTPTGPLSGTYTIGGTGCQNYPTFAAAFNGLNTYGVAGNVIFNVAPGYTETATAGGLSLGSTTLNSGVNGTSASQTVTFQKNGAGTDPLITASNAQVAGNILDAVIKLVGADYITFDGIDVKENAANTTTTIASNNMTEFGYALLYASLTDGAKNNTVKNSAITMNRSYANSFGIYSNTRHSSTNALTIAEPTVASGTNTNNTFSNNTVSNVSFPIVVVGTSTPAVMETGNTVSANTITSYGGTTGGSAYPTVTTFTANPIGVLSSNQINLSISNNVISTTASTSSYISGIYTWYDVAPTVNTTNTISGNTVTLSQGGSAASQASSIQAINAGGSFGFSGITHNIINNTVSNCAITNAAGGSIIGIFVNGAAAGTVTITGNSVRGNTSAATAGSFTGIRSAALSSTATNMSNNNIGDATAGAVTYSVATSGTIVGVYNSAAAASGTTLTINNNTVRGISLVTCSGTVAGIFNAGTASSVNITNNHIGVSGGNAYTFSGAQSGTVYGIENTSGTSAGSQSITGNDITGIIYSVAGSATQYNIYNTFATTTQTINNNTFTNLNLNTTGSVYFIYDNASFSSTSTQNVNGNSVVTAFNNAGAGGTVYGFYNNASTSAGAIQNALNNNYSNITVTGATSIVGWQNTDGGGATKNFSNNTFTNWTGGSGSITGMSLGYFSGTTGTVASNLVNNITGTGSITGITLNTVGSATTLNVNNNTITNLVSSGAGGAVIGLASSNPSTTVNIFSNIVNTLSSSSAGVTGITNSAGTTVNMNQNTVNTLSSAGASSTVAGITSTGGTTVNITSNKINTLSETGATSPVVSGISSSAGTTVNITQNKVYDLSSTAATPTLSGVLVSGGTTNKLSNNVVGDIRATAGSGTNIIIGINLTGGTNDSLYYNTVRIAAPTTTGTDLGSSAISASTSPTLTLRNNIFVNKTTAQGAGLTVAYRRSSATLTTYAAASNNNILFAGDSSITTNLIYYDGTTKSRTLVTAAAGTTPYRTIMTGGRDSKTAREDVPFASTTGSNANFLNISTSTPTYAESGGAAIIGLTVDYNNATRNATTPDIGAYEFTGIALAPTIVSATAANTSPASCAPTSHLVTATVTSNGAATVNLNYSFNGGTNTTTVAMTNTSGNTWTATIPIATPGNATVTWNVVATSTQGGQSSTFTGTPYADQPISAVTTGGAGTICLGSGQAITASATGSATVSYSWTASPAANAGLPAGAGTPSTTNNNITVTPTAFGTGTYLYTVTASVAGSSCTTTNSVSITVNQPSVAPTSITAAPTTICNGNSTTLTPNGGSLGTNATWHWYTDAGLTNQVGTSTTASPSLTLSPISTTTYYVRAEGGSPCPNAGTNAVSVTVTVNQPSVAPTSLTATPSTICTGGSTTLTQNLGSLGSNAYWQWYKDAAMTQTVGGHLFSADASLTVTPSGTTTYYVRAEGGTPCANAGTNAVSVTVTMNQPSVAPTSAQATLTQICNTQTTTLTQVGGTLGTGASWHWYSDAAFTNAVGSNTNADASISVNPQVTTTYYVRAEGPAPCATTTSAASVTITVNGSPTISYSGSPFCQVGNAIVHQTGTTGGTYTAPAGLSINAASGLIFPAASTPGNYAVTYTVNANGCASQATTTITILPTPTITLGTAAPVCFSAGAQTASLTYTATTNSPVTYSIRANASGPMPGYVPVVDASLSPNTISISIPAGTLGGTYYFDMFVKSATGCSSGKYGFQVFVVSQASTTITYNGSPFCRSGSSYGLVTRTGAAGGTYSSTPGLTVDATTGTIFPGTSTPGTYTVTYTINNSGCTFTTTTDVTVLATPTVNLSPVPSICFSPGAQTANLPYTGTSGSPVTYSLTAGPNSPMPGFVSVVNAALPASPITINIPAGTPGGLYYFTFSSKNAQGCVSGNYTVSVTIVGTNTTIAYNGGQPICQTGSAIVTRTGAAGGTYSSTAGLTIDASSGTIFPAASTAGTYTVTYTVVSASGCTFSTTTNVTIQALPKIAPITVAPVCQSAGATTASVPYTVTAGSPTTYTLTVSTANPMPNFVAVTDAPLTASPLTVNIPAGTAAGTYYFFITLKSAAGCTSAKYTFGITVKPLPTASISYAHSPYSTATGGATVTFSGTTGGTFSSTPGLNLNATTGSIYPSQSTPGNYTVSYTVTTASGCTVTATTPVTITPATTPRVVSTTPKSVTKTAPVVAVEEKITIAPNPVEHRVTVRVSNINDPMQIRITDATGKEILKGTKFTASYAFDMSGYAQGIYMVEVVNEKTGTVSRQKLMKK